jgi:preprotein translocase subunit SecD
MGRGLVAGLAASLVACVATAPPPPVQTRAAAAVDAREMVFDVDNRLAERMLPTFRRRLEAAGLHFEITAPSADTIVVRLHGGDPETVLQLAGGRRTMWLAPLDQRIDLRQAAGPLPDGVEPAVDEGGPTVGGGRGTYLRAPASSASALVRWLSTTHVPPAFVALMGHDDLPDPNPHLRTYVVARQELASAFDLRDVDVGEGEDGPHVVLDFDKPAATRLSEFLRTHPGRIAVVSHGRVIVAPVVQVVPATSVRFRISFGHGEGARQRRDQLKELCFSPGFPSPLHPHGVDPALE